MTCTRCGAPGANPVDIRRGEVVVATADLCPACVAEHAAHRRQFEELIASGVEPRMANRIMTVLVDRATGVARR